MFRDFTLKMNGNSLNCWIIFKISSNLVHTSRSYENILKHDIYFDIYQVFENLNYYCKTEKIFAQIGSFTSYIIEHLGTWLLSRKVFQIFNNSRYRCYLNTASVQCIYLIDSCVWYYNTLWFWIDSGSL